MSSTHIAGLALLSLLCGCAAPGATVPFSTSRPGEGQIGPLTADPDLLSTARGGTVVVTPRVIVASESAATLDAASVPPVVAPATPMASMQTPSVTSAPSAPQTAAFASAITPPGRSTPTPNSAADVQAVPAAPAGATEAPAAARPSRAATLKVPAPAVAEPARKTEITAPVVAQSAPAAPTLDIASLKSRLRSTGAIGVFSKLALKNQMDDVLEQFRAAYKTGQKTAPAALRQPYDMLVLKVLATLQDGDPALARSIAGSREAIWAILADADKFKTIA